MQHKRAVKNGDVNSALFIHAHETGHLPDWESVVVLEGEKDLVKRKMKEAWFTRKHQKVILNLNRGYQLEYDWRVLLAAIIQLFSRGFRSIFERVKTELRMKSAHLT